MSFRFGEFELDQERHLLLRTGRPVLLEPKAYELLSLLLERRPRAPGGPARGLCHARLHARGGADAVAGPGSREDRDLLVERNETEKRSVLSFHDLRTGTSRELTSHGNAVYSVALDPKGEIAVTGDWDGLVRVGGVNDEEPHLLYGHDLEVTSVAVSPDGLWVASGSQDGTIRLWPMPRGLPLHALPHEGLLARLRASTNLRVVEDPGSAIGYRVEPGPLPGWEALPAR